MINSSFIAILLFTKLFASTSTTSLSNFDQLRDERKIGVGGQILGASGSAGVLLEMNFHPSWGLNVGYGSAPDFQSFLVEYKQVLFGNQVTTYGLLGFTRWFGEANGSIESTNPGFVAEDFMSAKDRREGKIDENLLYPGIGVQYVQFSGNWAGFSLFGHLIVLSDIQDFVFVPTLGIGSIYYF